MKSYKIELYQMKHQEDPWIKFVPRRYTRTFKSLSELAKYITDNNLYFATLGNYIFGQLSRKERGILYSKIAAIYNKRAISLNG